MKFLATADLHLSSRKPLARKEANDHEWLQSQKNCLENIVSIANAQQTDGIIIAGDIFDIPRESAEVVNIFIDTFIDENVYFIAGNHDLPYHQYLNMADSSYGTIKIIGDSKKVNCCEIKNNDLMRGYSFGLEPDEPDTSIITVLHTFVVENENKILPNAKCRLAVDILNKFNSKFIVTGDNHEEFVVYHDGKYLINCGCPIKRRVTEYNYKVGVHIIDTDKNNVSFIPLSDDFAMIDTSIIEEFHEAEIRKEQYQKMLDEINANVQNNFDFLSTLSSYVKDNRKSISDVVADKIEDIIIKVKEI